jgi:membrane associated rhomboid family serine protease
MGALESAIIRAIVKSDFFRDLQKSLSPYLSHFPSLPALTTTELIWIFCGIIIAISTICLLHAPSFEKLALCSAGHNGSEDGWRAITYGLVHGGPVHLILNITTLYSFLLGLTKIIPFQACIIVFILGVFIPGWLAARFNGVCPSSHAVGASGGVAALIACSAMVSPGAQIKLFFFLPAISMWAGVGLILGLSFVFIWCEILPGIWHQGHILGIITGLGASWFLF